MEPPQKNFRPDEASHDLWDKGCSSDRLNAQAFSTRQIKGHSISTDEVPGA